MSSPPKQIHEWPNQIATVTANTLFAGSQNEVTGKIAFSALEAAIRSALSDFLTQAQGDARYALLSALSETIDDRVATLLVAGSNITIAYNDVANTLTIASTASGAGGLLTGGTLRYTATASTIAMTEAIAASGGVPPYTYEWYRSAAPNFAIGTGTLLPGATTATFTDTGLQSSTNYYYRRVTTDGLGNKQATPELAARTESGDENIS
jgi:hypothetical protein